jgi:hypothetical protein
MLSVCEGGTCTYLQICNRSEDHVKQIADEDAEIGRLKEDMATEKRHWIRSEMVRQVFGEDFIHNFWRGFRRRFLHILNRDFGGP